MISSSSYFLVYVARSPEEIATKSNFPQFIVAYDTSWRVKSILKSVFPFSRSSLLYRRDKNGFLDFFLDQVCQTILTRIEGCVEMRNVVNVLFP